MPNIASPPSQDSVIELDDSPSRRTPFYMAKSWIIWLQQSVLLRLSAAIAITKTVVLAAQAATIATTSLQTLTSGGLYRISYVIRVTQAATTSSSLTVTIGWVDAGVALTLVGSALTGNLTTSLQSASVVVRAAALSDLTYAVLYASVGATVMQYRIDCVVEQLA